MKFQFLRGACIIIEGANKRIMCDPWLTDGEYYGSWYHYPSYDWKDDLSDLDYIYVSHIHPDHFSKATMERLPKVPVLIHKFQTPFLRKNIEALGFEVRELPHNTPVDLGGIKINIIAADDCDPEACQKFFGCSLPEVKNTQIDSMAVFDDGKHVYVNANDCPYQLSRHMLPKIRLQYPEIDVLFVAYAGAGPYPQCFNYGAHKMFKLAQAKKAAFLHHVVEFAKGLKAKQTFPFAGDYLLGARFTGLNKFRGVPSLWEVYSWLGNYKVPLIRTELNDRALDYANDNLWMKSLDYEKDPFPSYDDITRLINEARKRVLRKAEEIGFAITTQIVVEDAVHSWVVFDDIKYAPSNLTMNLDSRLLWRLLMGPKYAHWNNAEIGSHIMFSRSPDVFQRGLHHVLSFLHV